MALLLDTTVLTDALRGRPAVDRLRRLRTTRDVPFICAVTAEDVVRGLRPGEEARVDAALQAFRETSLGVAEGRLAGRWRTEFSRRGVTLSQADCLVAAAAHGVGARLATGNPRDFPMPDVDVEHWPVGE